MVPIVHGIYNCKHFKVRDPVVAFCRYVLSGEEGDQVQDRTMELTKDARNSKTEGRNGNQSGKSSSRLDIIPLFSLLHQIGFKIITSQSQIVPRLRMANITPKWIRLKRFNWVPVQK